MMRSHYIGARYIPLVYEGPDGTNTWLPGVAYDGLVIVTYGTYSYMSKKPVPAGMDPPDLNPAYWIKAAVYNADVNNVVELLDQKADKDGVYPDLFAGNLISNLMQTDNTPYLERETGGGLTNIAPLCYPVLVGASVGSNQFVKIPANSKTTTVNGITFTDNRDGTYTANGTATADASIILDAIPVINGHRYLFEGGLSGGSSTTFCAYLTPNVSFKRDYGDGYITTATATNNALPVLMVYNGTTVNNLKFVPQSIDLTQMLGSSIADYIYSLEQSTEGAGIAKLKEWGFLTGEYIPYNAGTLESVEATAKVVRDENGENAVTYSLGSDVLRGLFKLDANNQLYADGDRKEADGTITRKYGIVDLGTLTWNVINTNIFYADVSGKAVNNANIICSNYTNAGVYENYNNFADKTIASSASVYRIGIKDSAYTDAAAFKTAMSGVYLVYELATPTTETSIPFTSPQICYHDGTEEFVTENGVPVGHETSYPYDLKGIIETLAEVPAAAGTYTLKATRSGANITYTWEQEV